MTALASRDRRNRAVFILVALYWASVISYPLDLMRITIAASALPSSILFFPVFLFAFLASWDGEARISRYAAVLLALVCSLALATVIGISIYQYNVDFERAKGVAYFTVPFILVPVFRKIDPDFLVGFAVSSGLAVVIVGYYRYVTMEAGLQSEHLIGYWGVRYLPATRNSDVLYPTVVAALSLGAVARKVGLAKLFYLIAFSASAFAVLLSLSRGAWLALFVSLLIMAKGRFVLIGYVFVGAATVAYGVIHHFEVEGLDQLLLERFFSIFTTGDSRVSNDDRVDLILDSIVTMLYNPLGVGIGNMGWQIERDGQPLWNSENAWLTLGVEGGVFSLVMAVALSFALLDKARMCLTSPAGLLTVSLLIYFIFNYELNSLYAWSVICVAWVLLEFNSSQKRDRVSIRTKYSSQNFEAGGCEGINKSHV